MPYEIPLTPITIERSAQSDAALTFGLVVIAAFAVLLVVTLVLAWRCRR